MSKHEDKRTIEEWSKKFGIKILDPDGFDRKDPLLFKRKFTKKEFENNSMFSTIKTIPGGKTDKIIRKIIKGEIKIRGIK